jgi:hypothetical protein
LGGLLKSPMPSESPLGIIKGLEIEAMELAPGFQAKNSQEEYNRTGIEPNILEGQFRA